MLIVLCLCVSFAMFEWCLCVYVGVCMFVDVCACMVAVLCLYVSPAMFVL